MLHTHYRGYHDDGQKSKKRKKRLTRLIQTSTQTSTTTTTTPSLQITTQFMDSVVRSNMFSNISSIENIHFGGPDGGADDAEGDIHFGGADDGDAEMDVAINTSQEPNNLDIGMTTLRRAN
jgi:hypothetical protein